MPQSIRAPYLAAAASLSDPLRQIFWTERNPPRRYRRELTAAIWTSAASIRAAKIAHKRSA